MQFGCRTESRVQNIMEPQMFWSFRVEKGEYEWGKYERANNCSLLEMMSPLEIPCGRSRGEFRDEGEKLRRG